MKAIRRMTIEKFLSQCITILKTYFLDNCSIVTVSFNSENVASSITCHEDQL
jgi:hypothetical protein